MTRQDDSRPRAEGEELAREVTRIITEVTDQSVPAHDTDLNTLGFDSIAMLDVLASLEARFSVSLNENMIREFRTVDRITRILKEVMRG